MSKASKKVLIVCSPGGHMQQMVRLRDAWRDADRTWVTLDAPGVDHLLDGERWVPAHGPTSRNLRNFFRNVWLAWRIVRAERPAAVLSTGAALAVPFFVIGWLHRCRLIYVETMTSVSSLSLTARLVYPFASDFLVQWPQAAGLRRRAHYEGRVL